MTEMTGRKTIISVAPAAARLGRLLGVQSHGVTDTAETVVFHPAETIYSPAAISLPGEIDKATGTMAHTTLEAVRREGEEGEFQHGATIGYRLKDVLLAYGSYYSKRRWQRVADGVKSPVVLGVFPAFKEAQFVTDVHFELYFGHWLTDGLMLELFAEQFPSPRLVFSRSAPRAHEADYRRITAISSRAIDVAHVSDLWIYDDRGLNRNKIARFQELRNRVRKAAPANGSRAPVYLMRGQSGASRKIREEGLLIEQLARRGFEVLDPVNCAPEESIGKLANAPLTVSIEGSHQSHAIMALPSGSAILSIQPEDRFLHSWKFLGDAAGIRTGFMVAAKAGDYYAVDGDRLLRTIDLMTG